MKTDCLFCQIARGEIPAEIVYENDNFIAFLDIKPINLGHTLLIPKSHHRNLFDLPHTLLAEIGPLSQQLATGIKEALGAPGINIGWNNEPAAGQLIFHAHIHIIPRYESDGLKSWPGKEDYQPIDFAQAAEKIKVKLKYEKSAN